MTDSSRIWTELLVIRSYDVDFKRQATLEVLCRYFLEAAWNHAEVLGFGFGHMARQNKLWVLSRLALEVGRYPRWGEHLRLQTWPRDTKSIFAFRDFELQDLAGGAVARGTSAWLILDVDSRRPQRVDKFLPTVPTVSKQALGRDPDKLPASTGTEERAAGQALYRDVDLNGHVNSARYIGWLFDGYPLEWHQAHAASRLEINYVGESRHGETLSIKTQRIDSLEFLHTVFKSDGQEACRARIHWTTACGEAADQDSQPATSLLVDRRDPKPGEWLSAHEFAEIVRLTPLVAIDLVVRSPLGRVLVGLRKNEPAKGVYFVPGSRITKNESIAEAFQRIAREELGVELAMDKARFLGAYEHHYPANRFNIEGFGTHYITLAYEVDYSPDSLALPTDQHDEYSWLSPEELVASPLVHRNTKAYFADRVK